MARGGKTWLAAAGALGVLVAAPILSGSWWSSKPKLTYTDYRVKADSIDATPGTIRYFANAGSLTTQADSSAGAMTVGTFYNASSGTLDVRIYHAAGTSGSGDTTYTTVHMLGSSSQSDADQWSIPPGMRVFGIAVEAWDDTSGLRWFVGRY